MAAAKSVLLGVALVLIGSWTCSSADPVCARCGNCECLRRVCVPKKTEREIIKVCWDYKCEDICIPGPSKKCGVECKEDACGCWSFEKWVPTCARVKTRRVPVKTEVKRKIPSVEWAVEYRCAACCQDGCTPIDPPAQAPAGLPAPSAIPR